MLLVDLLDHKTVCAMGGHADGVVAFGTDAGAAGFALLGAFVEALARD